MQFNYPVAKAIAFMPSALNNLQTIKIGLNVQSAWEFMESWSASINLKVQW